MKNSNNNFDSTNEIKLNKCVIITTFGDYNNNKHAKIKLEIDQDKNYTMDIFCGKPDMFIRKNNTGIKEYKISDYLDIQTHKTILYSDIKGGKENTIMITPEQNTYKHMINFYWNYDKSSKKYILRKASINSSGYNEDKLKDKEIYMKFDPKVKIKIAPRAFRYFGKIGLYKITDAKFVLYADCNNQTVEAPTDCKGMFDYAKSFTEVHIDNWDLGNVITMERMFLCCTRLTNIQFGEHNLPKITSMKECFYYCQKLEQEPQGKLTCNCLTDVSKLYAECKELTLVDLNWLDAPNITTMTNMFLQCVNLKYAQIQKNLSKITNMNGMFSGCYTLDTVMLPDIEDYTNGNNESDSISVANMFKGVEALKKMSIETYITKLDTIAQKKHLEARIARQITGLNRVTDNTNTKKLIIDALKAIEAKNITYIMN